MEYKIEKANKMFFLGCIINNLNAQLDLNKIIPKLWNTTMSNGSFNILIEYADKKRPIGLFFRKDSPNEMPAYLVGVQTKEPVYLDGFTTVTIDETEFVKFHGIANSTSALHDLKDEFKLYLKEIVNEKPSTICEIEFYAEVSSQEKNIFEYWISI